MNRKTYLQSLGVAFVIGAICAVAVYYRLRPNEAQQHQYLVEKSIRTKLCERILADLEKLDESPFSFRRSSLSELIKESEEITKTLVPLAVSERGITYKSDESTITRDCRNDARRWVKIQTVVPDELESEIRIVGLSEEQSNWQKINRPKGVSNVRPESSKRLALVIGNSNYESRPLRNPEHDADDMAEALRSAHFEVREVKNVGLSEIRSVSDEFIETASHYEVALVYYSGHGIEFQGRNYLLPVDANIKSDAEIPRMSLDLEDLLVRINRKKPTAIVMIVDACRSTPLFANSRSQSAGLVDMRPPVGTLIAFSAAPGQTASDGNGRNSPYTAALLKEMKVPNTPIEQILKEARKQVSVLTMERQVPWYNSSLVGDLYFIRD